MAPHRGNVSATATTLRKGHAPALTGVLSAVALTSSLVTGPVAPIAAQRTAAVVALAADAAADPFDALMIQLGNAVVGVLDGYQTISSGFFGALTNFWVNDLGPLIEPIATPIIDAVTDLPNDPIFAPISLLFTASVDILFLPLSPLLELIIFTALTNGLSTPTIPDLIDTVTNLIESGGLADMTHAFLGSVQNVFAMFVAGALGTALIPVELLLGEPINVTDTVLSIFGSPDVPVPPGFPGTVDIGADSLSDTGVLDLSFVADALSTPG